MGAAFSVDEAENLKGDIGGRNLARDFWLAVGLS
jgi:hypothetical protein